MVADHFALVEISMEKGNVVIKRTRLFKTKKKKIMKKIHGLINQVSLEEKVRSRQVENWEKQRLFTVYCFIDHPNLYGNDFSAPY